ncbi:hypothetical protein PP240_gp43 [Streptococcus phage P7574]|uniref:DUF1642 domain-containing protein n=1 Tax=Streptococcus phage P7574 TaxID=1971430 RepID=A0A286QRD4_9CAUD|nr:hypothetical protein PP240_gp43 [Streptococcus phage P7574]ARU13934.1 hypothetical protein P7574_43 [Streptococcus phage P7574]
MTRDEAVKKIAREGYISIEHAEELYGEIIPKPVVPQYVADWYEDIKKDFENKLFGYIRNFHIYKSRGESKDFTFWFDDNENAIQTLVNMYQFGYEVKKEERYAVRIRNLDDEATYLNYDNFRKTWVFYSRDNTDRFRTIHTRKELEEADFGWVFDCEGVEVKEVE